MPQFLKNSKKWLPGALVSIVVIAAILYFVDFSKMLEAIRAADYRILAVAMTLSFGWMLVRAKVWQTLLEIENYLNPQGNAVANVLYRKQADLSSVSRELQTVHRELGAIEKRLEDEVWLVGDTISAAA